MSHSFNTLPLRRVLMCVPAATDAAVIKNLLASIEVHGFSFDIEDLSRQQLGDADAILISEEMLDEGKLELLIETLHRQPEWSDVPVILVSAGGTESPVANQAMQTLTNVMLLDRPVRMATLLSTLKTALRSRSRQLHVRKVLADRKNMAEALRESQAQLTAILEQLPVGVGVLDPNGRFVLSNSVMRDHVLGDKMPSRNPKQMDKRESLDAEGQPIPPDQWPGARALRGESVLPGMEFRYIGDNGQEHWKLISAVPFRANGKIIGAISVAQDITERKRSQHALQELTATLEQRVAERTKLLEARTNQLQTLAVELIEAEERERRRISELLHDDLQQVLAGARLTLQSIREDLPSVPELLDVEMLLEESIDKSRRLSHELSPAVLHHSGLIPALEWLGRHMHEQFGLQVLLDADVHSVYVESTPLKVFLFRAAQELLFNIVKHAGVKSAHVILSILNEGLVLTVSDKGCGIDPRLNSPSAVAGLGLPSLRERANSIGGCLAIESSPGKGTRISLTVPAKLESTGAMPVAQAEIVCDPVVPALSPRSKDEKIIRVLFADDHKVMRQGLIRIITNQPDIQLAGEAANGREAIELAHQFRPDVIVMDIGMPEMDGIEATRRIKAELPDVRVIALSMFEDDQAARSMRDAGAEAFVSKTASAAELLKAIYGQ
ncbi:MAG: response regulator [Desulfobacteraceae bacterium]|nr:MAG: response regulator [Desulfobacteraceae bacterium]